MPNARERIVIEDDEYGRLAVAREPSPDLVPFVGTGPDRGAWEEAHPANDVRVEYEPPSGRAA